MGRMICCLPKVPNCTQGARCVNRSDKDAVGDLAPGAELARRSAAGAHLQLLEKLGGLCPQGAHFSLQHLSSMLQLLHPVRL